MGAYPKKESPPPRRSAAPLSPLSPTSTARPAPTLGSNMLGLPEKEEAATSRAPSVKLIGPPSPRSKSPPKTSAPQWLFAKQGPPAQSSVARVAPPISSRSALFG